MLIPKGIYNYNIWKKLTFQERALYLFLAVEYIESNNKSKGVLISVKDIINRYGMSKNILSGVIKNLVAYGLIKRNHTYRDNIYIVNPMWIKTEAGNYEENTYYIKRYVKMMRILKYLEKRKQRNLLVT